jgi:hypothetical protein
VYTFTPLLDYSIITPLRKPAKVLFAIETFYRLQEKRKYYRSVIFKRRDLRKGVGIIPGDAPHYC